MINQQLLAYDLTKTRGILSSLRVHQTFVGHVAKMQHFMLPDPHESLMFLFIACSMFPFESLCVLFIGLIFCTARFCVNKGSLKKIASQHHFVWLMGNYFYTLLFFR
jgi:hypothetical protein